MKILRRWRRHQTKPRLRRHCEEVHCPKSPATLWWVLCYHCFTQMWCSPEGKADLNAWLGHCEKWRAVFVPAALRRWAVYGRSTNNVMMKKCPFLLFLLDKNCPAKLIPLPKKPQPPSPEFLVVMHLQLSGHLASQFIELGNVSRDHLNKEEKKILRKGLRKGGRTWTSLYNLVLRCSEGKINCACLFCVVWTTRGTGRVERRTHPKTKRCYKSQLGETLIWQFTADVSRKGLGRCLLCLRQRRWDIAQNEHFSHPRQAQFVTITEKKQYFSGPKKSIPQPTATAAAGLGFFCGFSLRTGILPGLW